MAKYTSIFDLTSNKVPLLIMNLHMMFKSDRANVVCKGFDVDFQN